MDYLKAPIHVDGNIFLFHREGHVDNCDWEEVPYNKQTKKW